MKLLLMIALLGSSVLLAEPSVLEKVTNPSEKNKPTASTTQVKENCATPKIALINFFNGDKEHDRLACMDGRTRTTQQLSILRERLIKIFEQQGVVIQFEDLPDDEKSRAESSERRYVLTEQFPDIALEHTTAGWIFPKDVIDSIDQRYAAVTRDPARWLYKWAPTWAVVDIFGINGFSLIQVFYLLILFAVSFLLRFIVIVLISHHTGKYFTNRGLQEFEDHLRRASSHLGNLVMAGTLITFIPSLDFNVHVTSYLLVACHLGAAISVVLICYRSVDLVTHYLLQKALKTESRLDDQLVPLFGRGLKILVIIMGAIFVLQNLDVDVTSLLAGVTIGGLAISFAAKDTVANLFGSVTIFADKPFLVGDWIKAADVEGIVELVGFRSTRIRTFYNSLVTVPNSKFTESVVDNMGARRYRRTDTKLMLPFDTEPDMIEAFCNGIRAIIKAHPKTRKDAYEVHLSEFGEHCLKVMVFYFAEVATNSQEMRCRHEIFLDILRLARTLNLRFAFPTSSVLIDRMATMKDPERVQELKRDELMTNADRFAPQGEFCVAPGPRLGKAYFSDQLPESAYR